MTKKLEFPVALEMLTDVQLFTACKKAIQAGDEARVDELMEECRRRRKLNIFTRATQMAALTAQY